MLRTIAGLVAGLIVGVLVVGLAQGVGHAIFPPPEDTSNLTVEEMRAVIANVSPPAMVAVLISWGLGSAAGGTMASWIARVGLWPAYVIGAIIFAAAAWTMMLIPHPWWMWLGALLAIGAGAWLGGQAAARLNQD